MTPNFSTLSIIDALTDAHLFGGLPAFRDLSPWRAWVTALKAVYGLALTADEERVFCQCTGRSRYQPPVGGYPEAVFIVGRQAGKTRVVGTLTAFEALRAPREADHTEVFALSIAQDHRASLRALFRYARSPFERLALLRPLVRAKRADEWALTNGTTLAAMPCRPAAVRGLRARVIALDELGFFRSSENLPVDVEMLRACRPCLATTGGKLVILSSPAGATGALWELHRQHHGVDTSSTLVWSASAPTMNPTLPADYLARLERDDPEAYRQDVLGEFRQGVSALLDPDALDLVVDRGVRERPPEAGRRYVAFVDASGGRHDRFCVAVAHQRADGVAVLDTCWAWTPPLNPGDVIAAACARLREYGIHEADGDKFAAEFVVEHFGRHGVTYRASARDRSRIYVDVAALVNADRVVLLDDADLLREYRGLERHVSRGGREVVDHRRGGFDDRANAASGALTVAAGARAPLLLMNMNDGSTWIPGQDRGRRLASRFGLTGFGLSGDLVTSGQVTRETTNGSSTWQQD